LILFMPEHAVVDGPLKQQMTSYDFIFCKVIIRSTQKFDVFIKSTNFSFFKSLLHVIKEIGDTQLVKLLSTKHFCFDSVVFFLSNICLINVSSEPVAAYELF